MKIYTKTGDDGTTSLFSGGRVAKDDARIEAYGTVDELNAVLGLVLCEPLPDGAMVLLRQIQSDLFKIGSVLADVEGRLSLSADDLDLDGLEAWIDAMEGGLPPLKSFILPGGSRTAALAHLARTVCRRAERRVLGVAQVSPGLAPAVLKYLNRLSDALFVFARYVNARMGVDDPEWTSREER